MSKYQPIIGLEIHVELKTKSKMFCQCAADYFGKEPNTNTCPVCLGLPGALPVPNKKAVEWTILIGKALNCTINKHSKFDRKHYFYPDLPKGYQISQYDEPLAVKGFVEIGYPESKRFRIHRVHLEEDTGKLLHQGSDTLIDFNRSSVPLVEIVTEPDFHSSEDVKAFLEELHTIIRYLEISDADMEKGTMRLEPNISLSAKFQIPNSKPQIPDSKSQILNPKSQIPNSKPNVLPPYKVEIKNINSFNYVKRAIDYELIRQEEILESGKTPVQETRGYNEAKGTTYSQRSKEEAHDYRYFPEPDIPPMEFSDSEIAKIVKTLPELPSAKAKRYVETLGVKYADAFTLTRDKAISTYFENVLEQINKHSGTLQSKRQSVAVSIANYIVNKRISTEIAVNEFVKKAVELLTPKTTDPGVLANMIDQVISQNPKVVADYKSGKQNAVMFLVGQVMRAMKGQADATIVRQELVKKLS